MDVLAEFETLKRLVAAIAPESVENLNPPASEALLEELRSRVPLVPSEWLIILGRYNGEEMISWNSMFPDGMQLMDVEHILEKVAYQESRRFLPEEHEEPPPGHYRVFGPVKPIPFNKCRVPFAHINAELLWLFDFDPAPGGSLGQIVYEDVEDGTFAVVAPSLADLFHQYRTGLESGAFREGEDGQIESQTGEWYVSPEGQER